MLSDFFWNILRYGPSSNRSSSSDSGNDKNKGSGPLGIVIFALAIVLYALDRFQSPVIAGWLSFAAVAPARGKVAILVSRSRR